MLALPVACRTFVGRRSELALLRERARAASAGRGSLVLIGGEPGIGKTRLLSEFIRSSAKGLLVARAECVENASAPFDAVRALLRTVLASERVRARVTPLIGRALQQLLPENGPYFPDDLGEAPPLERAELFAALVAFLRLSCDERVTLLTIEDLHWVHPSVLEFLAYAEPRIGSLRLLIVATYRADDMAENEALRDSFSALQQHRATARLELGGLESDDVRAVIAGALEGHPHLSLVVRENVERRAEGNPFFVEELIKSVLERVDGRALSMSLRGMILERLAGLDERQRSVLAGGAVLGQRFEPVLLAALLQRDGEEIAPVLRRGCALNLLVADGATYRFRHALTQEAIYGDLLRVDARRLHERALSVLENRSATDGRLDELAHHAQRAGDAAKTLVYSERAGDAALAMRALPEAAAHYRCALDAAADESDRLRLTEKSARMSRMRGDLGHSTALSTAAFEARMRRREFDLAAVLIREIVMDRNHRGDVRAIADLAAFFERHGAELSAAVRDRLLSWMGRYATCVYNFEAAAQAYAGLSPLERLEAGTRFNYWQGSLVMFACRNDGAAWRGAVRGLRATLGDLPPLVGAVGLGSLAQTALSFGENAEAQSAIAESLACAQAWGDHPIVTFTRALEAQALWLRGRLSEARTALEAAFAAPHIPVTMTLAGASGPLVALALDDGELAERCSTLIEPLLSRAREDVNGVDAMNFGAFAAWRAARGELAQARGDLCLGLGALASADQLTTFLPMAAHLLDGAELARTRSMASANAALGDNPVAHATLAQVEAIVAERSGDDARRLAQAQAAAEIYRALEWPLLEAQNRELAGERDGARALYCRCGSVADVLRLDGVSSASVPRDPLERELSQREAEIAELVIGGHTNAEIAQRLSVTHKTVEKHLSSVYAKLAVRSRYELISRRGGESRIAPARR